MRQRSIERKQKGNVYSNVQIYNYNKMSLTCDRIKSSQNDVNILGNLQTCLQQLLLFPLARSWVEDHS